LGEAVLGSVSQAPEGARAGFAPQAAQWQKGGGGERVIEVFWREAGRKWECNFLLGTVRPDPC